MGMKTNKDGYFWDPDGLRRVSGMYRDVAEKVDQPLHHLPTSVDAGASSEQVAHALSTLAKLAAKGTMTARTVADRIHATDGSYADIEQDNRNGFKSFQYPR